MKRTLLAFTGLVFTIYWLCTAELPSDRPAALLPSLSSPLRPSPAVTPERKSLQSWLSSETHKMKRRYDSTSAVIRLKRKALSMKAEDLAGLRAIALDSETTGEERYLAVYVLGLSEAAAARDLLQDISRSAVPTSANEKGYSDEIAVRTHALESLIKRLSPAASAKFLREILTKSNDPALVRRAQYWLSRTKSE
jgi:hypothetical protein